MLLSSELNDELMKGKEPLLVARSTVAGSLSGDTLIIKIKKKERKKEEKKKVKAIKHYGLGGFIFIIIIIIFNSVRWDSIVFLSQPCFSIIQRNTAP